MQLTSLKFVSEKREKDFAKLNIYSVEDLVRFFPRDYLDLRRVTPLYAAYHNDVVLTACEVLNVEINRYSKRPTVKALCQQNGRMFTAIWFNQPYVAAKLAPGEYLFYGRVRNKYGFGCQMVNPSFEPASKAEKLKGIIPVYTLSGSLTQGVIRTAMSEALKKVDCPTYIPRSLCEKYSLMPLNEAYAEVHSPSDGESLSKASARIAVEEYFLLISAFKVIKGGRDDERKVVYGATSDDVRAFASRFPFEFTEGQKSAVNEIYLNLRSPHRMNRLLQGDVGSGKTAVALAAIYMAVKSGHQAVMAAPTEVLARQNAALLETYLPEYSVKTLTGATPAAEKKLIKKQISSGEAAIVCGTHAVFRDDVVFSDLALAVCDEQHRFGVAQRSSLSDKGNGADVLVMSATPIPRTLSLIFYGDLDITTIKDKPRCRAETVTAIVTEKKYADMYAYIAKKASEGEKTYFVCPKIEGDEEGTVMSVTELYEELSAKLPEARIALLHGKMSDSKKNAVMEAFKGGEYDCLVSTTVIEVGVDVPDATTMVIYNAERFGLAQLHQLRGRVGRGDKKSYCFLLPGADSEEARERLNAVKNSTDGFEIAEADLKMRGGGDFMGTRQSGRVLSEIKNLRFPVETLFKAKALSDEAFSDGSDVSLLSRIAVEKYESLKDVVLN